ncbi:MAG TPA: glycosyltransferase family 39 protein, partial [Kamptonema sp.]|nr:glycosyltransferase family 39 protein [Kamptonema sp.]
MNYNRIATPNRLQVVLLTSLLIGVFFRFANLDRKLYWFDEVINTIYSSGYTKVEWQQQVKAWNGQQLSIKDLQKYQFIKDGSNSFDVIKAVAIEEPQNPPLYYLLSRWWVQVFGNSVVNRRSLSAFLSLLGFPCIYWLCLELFNSKLTAWIAIALLAVSPFHILYAQEVRMYAAWTVTILLSSAAFLWAIRLNDKLQWVTYTVTLILGFYTFPFSILVAIGHGIYIAIIEKLRFTKTSISYLLASLAAIVTFSPWIIFIIANSHKMGKWREVKITFLDLTRKWVTNLARGFIYIPNETNKLINIIFILASLILLITVLYSFYFLCRHTQKQVWLLIFNLAGITALTLILPDLILGGQRSIVAKYLIPSYLGILLAVAYLLATQILQANLWQRQIGQALTFVLITSGLFSSAISFQDRCDFNKKFSCDNLPVASRINKSTRPLLIGNSSLLNSVHILSLSYLLHPQATIMFVVPPDIPKITESFSDIFVYSHNKSLLEGLEKELDYKIEPQYKLEPMYQSAILKLDKLTLIN